MSKQVYKAAVKKDLIEHYNALSSNVDIRAQILVSQRHLSEQEKQNILNETCF
jgi:hypothetical protein